MCEHLTTEIRDGVLYLTLNRPDKKNALTQEMYAALAGALELSADDSDIRVIHLSAAGEAFSAGNDIADFAKQQAASPDQTLPVFRFLRQWASMDVPIVAAVNGVAIGIGVTLLLHCDFVYASDTAVFSTPFVDLALVPEAGSSLIMPLQMGHLNAARLLLLGESFDASQARECALVTEVVSQAELLNTSRATAAALAGKPPSALRTSKHLMKLSYEPVAQRMEREFAEFGRALQTPEAAEAMAAFLEKRAPDYTRFE